MRTTINWPRAMGSPMVPRARSPAASAIAIAACASLLCPDGLAVFSTINRNPKSYLVAVIGAEYVLRLLPRGTHDYARFIRPTELSRHARNAGLDTITMTGMTYNPMTLQYLL